MKIRLHPLANGQHYSWSKFRSLFDFFFPYSQNGDYQFIRLEATAQFKETQLVSRDFYTFRAFFLHYFLTYIWNPIRDWRKNAEAWAKELGLNPEYASQIGAIALDNHVINGNASFSYTVTGSNPLIMALNMGGLSSNAFSVSGITYNSVSLSNVDSLAVNLDFWISDWILPGCATGSNTLAITNSGLQINCYIVSVSGAKQTAQPDAHNTANANAVASLSCSVNTVADNSWTFALFRDNVTRTYSYNAGTTKLDDDTPNGTSASATSNGPITPAGSTSLGFSLNTAATAGLGIVMLSIAPGGNSFTQTFSETITGSETFTKLTQAVKSETITGSEVFAKQTNKNFATETITGTEVFAKQPGKGFAEIVNISGGETFIKLIEAVKSETITLSEVFSKQAQRVFSETLSLSEVFFSNIIKEVTSWAKKALNKTDWTKDH